MYFRNPDYLGIDRMGKPARPLPQPKPLSLKERLTLSVGMIATPVAAFLLVLGIGRLLAAL